MELRRNFEDLAIAIVKQAATDWRSAVRRLAKCPEDKRAEHLKSETERFFRSEWCYEIGGVDGGYILARLKSGLKED